jgi:hypothetical protein
MAKKGTLEIKPRQQARLEDPRFGFINLLECVFHEARNMHLIPIAEKLLVHIKEKGLLDSDWKTYLEDNPSITYSNYQSVLRKLRSVGMLRKERGVYRLSHDFSTFLNTASGCWTRFLVS